MNTTKSTHVFGITAVLLPCLILSAQVGAPARRSIADARLTGDRAIVHVLNRLTFGPRADDVSNVRKLGLEQWIDLQLHPERIPDNPTLEARLKPLGTLSLATWQIMEKYGPQQMRPQQTLQNLLPSAQLVTRLQSGTAEERREVLDSLSPTVRQQVLALAPARILEGLPDIQEEAAKARTAQQFFDVPRPPQLNALLTPEQLRVLRGGSDDEKLALINALSPETRKQVLRVAGGQLNGIPQLRREALAASQPQQAVNQDLVEARLFRAIYSDRQLEEVLTDFWMNHFNIFSGKMQLRLLLTSFERDAIRPHVLGRFKDMLLATARHPAMLIYLDNFLSQAPRDLPGFSLPDGGQDRRPGINENYGRELLELHTLGVDGGYTQDDVLAVARAFTGWTVYDPQRYAEFQFNPAGHDRKEKTILGVTLPAGRGEQDGLDVIDILARHPSTARFISKKLAQRFVADDPPQALIDRLAATFTSTGGDLRAVLQTLFRSPEFASEDAWQAKIKSPFELAASTIRALDADVFDTFALAQRLAEMGMPLYGRVDPKGYPNTGEGWLSAGDVLSRINFITAAASGQIPGVKPNVSRFNFKPPAVVGTELLGIPLRPDQLETIENTFRNREAAPSAVATVILASPEFQRR
jgi:uncharacterized protein (DUF1800 family)